MASTETERFTSKFRKDRFDARRERNERRNKAFEPGESGDVKESTPRVSVGISVRSSARPVSSGRTGDGVVKSEVRKSELESVTSRINRLKVTDDKDGPEDTPAQQEDPDFDEDHEKKLHLQRKERGAGATTSKKRQQRKNLREKRRSTGVVIMPNMEMEARKKVGMDGSQAFQGDTAAASEETNKVKENTYQNESVNSTETQGRGRSRGGRGDEWDSIDKDTLIQQLEAYQQAIQEWRDEFEKSQKEIDSLRNENQRLKDENSSLLKVVSQLSSTSRK